MTQKTLKHFLSFTILRTFIIFIYFPFFDIGNKNIKLKYTLKIAFP